MFLLNMVSLLSNLAVALKNVTSAVFLYSTVDSLGAARSQKDYLRSSLGNFHIFLLAISFPEDPWQKVLMQSVMKAKSAKELILNFALGSRT